MSERTYNQPFWEQLWSKTLREQSEKVAERPPSAHLVREASDLPPGRALDAGCGHGVDAMWLAARGWQVTAVDFSPSALARGRSAAELAGGELAARIRWVEAELASWDVPAGQFELVVCSYVHIATSVEELVRRLASGVAVFGTLLMVGHRPLDPSTGRETPAAGQVQVSVEAARAALDPRHWELIIAEELPRTLPGDGVDAVIRARRIR